MIFRCCVIIFLISLSNSFAISAKPFPVCTDPHQQINPTISYPLVVWQDDRNGNWDIYAYNIETKREFPICTAPGDQTEPYINFNWHWYSAIITWQDNRNGNWDIYAFELQNIFIIDPNKGREIPICTNPADQEKPFASNGAIWWQDYRNGNWDIYKYQAYPEPCETPQVVKPGDQINPNGCGYEDNSSGNWDIYKYSASLEDDIVYESESDQTNLSAHWCGFLWQDNASGNWDVYRSFDEYGVPGPIEMISNGASNQKEPIAGMFANNYLFFWIDDCSGDWDIYCCDWNKKVYPLIIASGDQQNISSSNDSPEAEYTYSSSYLVWQDNRNGNWDIYVAFICANGNCDDADVHENQLIMSSTLDLSEGSTPSECGYNDCITVWHKYVSEVSGIVDISTAGSDFDTTLAAYDLRDAAESLACNDDVSSEDITSEIAISVVRGKTYYIRVAGFDGEAGNYNLLVSPRGCPQFIAGDTDGNCRVDLNDVYKLSEDWLKNNLR